MPHDQPLRHRGSCSPWPLCLQADRSKKPAHGGVPFWFKGDSGNGHHESRAAALEGNRRMLRRQKAHHHSAEDEWLKVHRCDLPSMSTSRLSVPSDEVWMCEALALACLRCMLPKPCTFGLGLFGACSLTRVCMQLGRRYVEELEKSKDLDVLFYGDSIIEEWRCAGHPWERLVLLIPQPVRSGGPAIVTGSSSELDGASPSISSLKTGWGCCATRGTFLGATWGPFADVKKVWQEYFESKPYRAQAFGIAGERNFA